MNRMKTFERVIDHDYETQKSQLTHCLRQPCLEMSLYLTQIHRNTLKPETSTKCEIIQNRKRIHGKL